MAAPWAKNFYTSKAWQQTRAAYLQSRDGLCERCRARGKLEPATIVHHRIHLTADTIDDPTLTLSWTNLEALCEPCHNREHFRNESPQRYAWQPDGSILPT